MSVPSVPPLRSESARRDADHPQRSHPHGGLHSPSHLNSTAQNTGQPNSLVPDLTSQELNEIERHILNTLRSLRFGTLEIVIHDSRVVQIERSEKTRFDAKGKPLSESLS